MAANQAAIVFSILCKWRRLDGVANMASKAQQPIPASLPAEGYVRLPQVLAAFPVSRSTWLAGVKSGRFPQSVKLGPRTTAWRVEDIRNLIHNAG